MTMFKRSTGILRISLLTLFSVSALLLSATPRQAASLPTPLDPEQLSLRLHGLINEERAKATLPPLAWSPELQAIARQHSRDMAVRNYLGHVNPEGETPTDRGERAGYTCRRDEGDHFVGGLAENLFQNHLYRFIHLLTIDGRGKTIKEYKTAEEIAVSTVAGWMASEGHRQNILQTACGATGIGIAIAEDGKIYITQLFC